MRRTLALLGSMVAVVVLGGGLVGVRTAASMRGAQQVEPHEHGTVEDEHSEGDADGHDHGGDDAVEDNHGQPDPHAGHAHAEEEAESGHGDGADHGDHADHAEEWVVELSEQERAEFGVELATASVGTIANRIRLPGKVVLNGDLVAHVVPRAPGIVREVLKSVGDAVEAGDILAWLESAELGEAKVDYLVRWAEVGCCTIDFTRAQEVHDNTLRLVEVLKTAPSLEVLRDMNGIAMGDNRSALVSAYAEVAFAKAAYDRQKPLFEKKVVSEREYQAAEAAYKKAEALYAAAQDNVQFNVRRELAEAQRAQQVRKMELKGAERRLYVSGLTAEDIKGLELLAQRQTDEGQDAAVCTDPNCKGCAGHQGGQGSEDDGGPAPPTEEKLAWYPLRAPFDGVVIERHLTLGEKHGDDADAFTVADLRSVWVDISVFQKDLPQVKKGQAVWISTPDGMAAQGTVSFIAPIVDEATRTALARMVLPNPDLRWRPGLFVNAELSGDENEASVVIPKSAVQRMEGETVVFVDEGHGLEAVPVSLGRSDARHVEVLSGLSAGDRFVVAGAFELKAKIVTSGLGAHAGHGH
ncbi:MAG TPA: efflux RND transporter periplasmic adaptor subunit [Phycisphaerae bacterium]|nr:efflux RND transporter periplasmic adaptor subunit [Phycisphaerae bacterium]